MLTFLVENWQSVLVFALIAAFVVSLWRWAVAHAKMGFLGILVVGLSGILFLVAVAAVMWVVKVGPPRAAEFVRNLKAGILIVGAAADAPPLPANQLVLPPPTPFVVAPTVDPNASGGSTTVPGCWAGRTVPVGVMLQELTATGPAAAGLAVQVDFLSGGMTGDPANPLCSTQKGAWVWPRDLP